MNMNTAKPVKPDPSLWDVRMVFQRETGETVLWNPDDCVEMGTPIDEDSGDDLVFIGLCRVDEDENPIQVE